jgi:hypothetical protein
VLLLFGALAAGCSDKSTGEDKAAAEPAAKPQAGRRAAEPPARGRDLPWLGRLHRWEANLRQDAFKVASMGEGVDRGRRSPQALRRPLVELTRCERNLLRHVREPDASRYRPGYDLLAQGCRSLKHAAFTMIHAIDKRTRVPLAEVRRDSRRSSRLFRRGSTALEGSLRANRSLRIIRGSLAESKIEPELSDSVSEFALHTPAGVEVRCWSTREWRFVRKEWGTYVGTGDLLGFVHGAQLRTSVAPRICKQLARFVYRRERPSDEISLLRMSEAVAVLSHESEHIRNRRGDEATTECHAMQRMRRLARIMGASKTYADLLAGTYWTELYEFNLPEYRTAACRDGGPLDLHPDSGVWP